MLGAAASGAVGIGVTDKGGSDPSAFGVSLPGSNGEHARVVAHATRTMKRGRWVTDGVFT